MRQRNRVHQRGVGGIEIAPPIFRRLLEKKEWEMTKIKTLLAIRFDEIAGLVAVGLLMLLAGVGIGFNAALWWLTG